MTAFLAAPLENGLFKITADGKELEGEYTQEQLGEIYAELWAATRKEEASE